MARYWPISRVSCARDQSRHLAQKPSEQPPGRLVERRVPEPHQCPPHEHVGVVPFGQAKVHGIAPVQKGADLGQRPQSFGIECQDHPPMIPNPHLSGSCHVGTTHSVQAHVTWDKAQSESEHETGVRQAAWLMPCVALVRTRVCLRRDCVSMRATVANAGGVLRLGRWAEPRRLDDEPSSVFHGLSTGAVPSNMKAAVGRRW